VGDRWLRGQTRETKRSPKKKKRLGPTPSRFRDGDLVFFAQFIHLDPVMEFDFEFQLRHTPPCSVVTPNPIYMGRSTQLKLRT